MERDRDKELQDLLQTAHQAGAPILNPEPIVPTSSICYEVRLVVSESGTEKANADS